MRRAVARVLSGADEEATIHHVSYRLLTEPALREGFRGGNVAAWLTTVAKNAAIDVQRRRELERRHLEATDDETPPESGERDAKIVLGRFVESHLPAKLRPVFEARFLRQLTQREAADELGIPRTTLAYHEEQILDLLRRFVLEPHR